MKEKKECCMCGATKNLYWVAEATVRLLCEKCMDKEDQCAYEKK